MHARPPYAKRRLSAAIDRFLTVQGRLEKIAAARWVSAWSHFNDLYSNEALRRRMVQEPVRTLYARSACQDRSGL